MLPKKVIILIILAFALSACSMPYVKQSKEKGVYHRVKRGETLWQIAKAYNINLQELAESNNIVDPNLIQADSVLFIRDASQVIDDVMASAKLVGTSSEAVKAEKTPGQPDKTETVKEANIEPSVSAVRDSNKIAEEAIKKTAPPSAIKEEDITKETIIAKILPVPQNGKPEQKTVPSDKDRSGTAIIVKEESKTILSAGQMVPAAKAPPAKIDTTPPKVPENKEEEGKVIAGKTDPPAIQAPEGTAGSGLQFDKKRFIWPLPGRVISRFGIQPNGMYLNGIKIAAKEGTPVVAAAEGIVIFSASLKGYGETIIIKHEDNFATVYTHLFDRMVNIEHRVKKGDKIALLGRSEKEGEAYLNFEIRQNNKARNPLFFLP
ncbi:MAG: peptidoglycan DD-metalloendopeptidase family protein [Deltaproteobacteria bacterium]|nr:peptidoglycan DD-metalloendopeptidase family protein [Deltaproteobacteria bacterium]